MINVSWSTLYLFMSLTQYEKTKESHVGKLMVYVLQPCGDSVSLLESVALISEGTTGLVTWESALYLAEWALDHQQAFTGRYGTTTPTLKE